MINISPTILEHLISILIILIIAFIGFKIGRKAIEKILKTISEKSVKEISEKRASTLISTLNSVLTVVIWVIAIMMILPELGIDATAIIASVGLTSLAIGLGAKQIVGDYINGMIILFDGQFDVGDVIKVGSLEGKVVEFDLRKTTIKDKETKKIYFIPNSNIGIMANLSKK